MRRARFGPDGQADFVTDASRGNSGNSLPRYMPTPQDILRTSASSWARSSILTAR